MRCGVKSVYLGIRTRVVHYDDLVRKSDVIIKNLKKTNNYDRCKRRQSLILFISTKDDDKRDESNN
jgi:hypothetical protein